MGISIHALREEGDGSEVFPTQETENFYPRPPRGGRPTITAAVSAAVKFLSTPSARRATNFQTDYDKRIEFLSTPSARRATLRDALRDAARDDFYPRPPRGGRPATGDYLTLKAEISIHALREEGDSRPLCRR